IAEVLKLSWPAGLSMLTGTTMRFVDGLMVSWLSPEPFAAQFMGGMAAFVFESFILGTLTATTTYVSQNLGAGRPERCGEYARAGLLLAAALAVLCLPLVFVSRPLFALIGHAPRVQAYEAMYFRYMIAAIFIGQSAIALQRFFYGVHHPRIVLAVAVIANAFNVLCNYVLIFGKLGFPALGLEGAAIGTIAGITLQLGILAAVFLGPKMHGRFATRRAQVSLVQCREILRVGWPAGLQFCNDLLSWGLMASVLVGMFGTEHLAAHTAAIRYMGLSFMPAVGIGIAATALVGKYIGQGRPDLARRRAHAALVLGVTYMGACALGLFLLRHPLIGFFVTVAPTANVSAADALARADQVVRIGARIMICAALFQVFDAMAIVYVGALRGAGDTRWPMVVTFLLSWAVIAGGGGLAVCIAPELTSLGPWIAASAYVIVLGIILARRFESGAWEKIDLLGKRPIPDAEFAALTPEPRESLAVDPPDPPAEVVPDGRGKYDTPLHDDPSQE
ncbi:MAG TPA: MATE family efflux transporter, partial [Phycisphaerae bacterium]|nr:MATE family efflux transporter [Phycisphaerae bacterium]